MSKNLEDNIETSNSLKTNLQISCENISDLTNDFRMKKEEMKEQDHKISLLLRQAEEYNEEKMQLRRTIEQVKDENTRIENQVKVERQERNTNVSQNAEILQLYAKFEEFKKDVSNQLSTFNTKQDESQTSQTKKKEKRKRKKKKKKSKQEEESEDLSEENTDTESDDGVHVTEAEQSRIVLRPGPLQYNEAVKNSRKERKTLVLSTSITRDIKEQRFNECYSDGCAQFVRLRGWKAKNIKEDAKKNLQLGYFDSAIIHIGGNDLQDLYYPESFPKLAKEIVGTGLTCRERGADTVFIAGVTVRK